MCLCVLLLCVCPFVCLLLLGCGFVLLVCHVMLFGCGGVRLPLCCCVFFVAFVVCVGLICVGAVFVLLCLCL